MYTYVCVAGTFDGIHKGHEALLRKAFEESTRVLIGLTSDTFVSRYKSPKSQRLPISSYDRRKQELLRWLDSHEYLRRATVVPIDDPFEPAVSDPKLEALVVSEQTSRRGEEINTIRRQRGFTPLDLIVVAMVPAEDHKPISTTRVQKGEIDPTGKLIMPDFLRDALARPLGMVRSSHGIYESIETQKINPIITVGDLTTKTVLDTGVTPTLMIIDNKVNRVAYPDLLPILKKRKFSITRVVSGPGFISKEAYDAIGRILADQPQDTNVIEVDGEEDLLALPAIIVAPLGSVLYYGQPPIAVWSCGPVREGVVEVLITDEKKHEARILLQQFTQYSTI